jgi:hypothetical protein
MVARLAWLLCALFSSALTVGCRTADCEKVCEQNNACPGATKGDCKAQCGAQAELARAASCTDKFDELTTCSEKRKDPCAPGACATELKVYQDCIYRYCHKNPAATGCR